MFRLYKKLKAVKKILKDKNVEVFMSIFLYLKLKKLSLSRSLVINGFSLVIRTPLSFIKWLR
jgi:hypothetical protein